MLNTIADWLLRATHREKFPEDLYDVQLPDNVELRLGTKYLEWASGREAAYQNATAPAGAISRTIIMHPYTLHHDRSQLNRLIRHELGHTSQFEEYGFLGTYARYWVGKKFYGYVNHPMEKDATSRGWREFRNKNEPESLRAYRRERSTLDDDIDALIAEYEAEIEAQQGEGTLPDWLLDDPGEPTPDPRMPAKFVEYGDDQMTYWLDETGTAHVRLHSGSSSDLAGTDPDEWEDEYDL